jgi:hypothetical protein
MTGKQKLIVACGGIGVAVAIVLTVIASHSEVSPLILLVLWPTSIFGAGTNDPPTFSFGSAFLILLMYGGNAVLYGLLGLLISQKVRSRSKP